MAMNRAAIIRILHGAHFMGHCGTTIFTAPVAPIVEKVVVKSLYTSWRAQHDYRLNRTGLVVAECDGQAVVDGLRLAEEYIPNFHSIVVEQGAEDVEEAILAWGARKTHWTTAPHRYALDVVGSMAKQRRALGVYVPVYVPGDDDDDCWRTLWTLADSSLPVCLFIASNSPRAEQLHLNRPNPT
jgi:hypothetical protein